MSRAKKFFPNAEKYANKINKIIDSGFWIYTFDDDDTIIKDPLIILEEEYKIKIPLGENSQLVIWGDGWNDSVQYLKNYFEKCKLVHPEDIKDFLNFNKI